MLSGKLEASEVTVGLGLGADFERDVSTLDDLRAAAKEPDKVIKGHLDEHGRVEFLSAWLQRTGG